MKNKIKFILLIFLIIFGLNITTTTPAVYANHTITQPVKYDYDVTDNFSESNKILQKNTYDNCQAESPEVFFCQNSKLLGPKSTINASNSILREFSEAAFKAADDIGEWIPKNKHLFGGGSQSSAKFITNNIDEVRAMVSEGLRSSGAQFLPNPNVPGTFRVIADMGRKIGIKGQQKIRIIVGGDGKVINAFPVNIQ